MTGQLPQYLCAGAPAQKVIEEVNSSGPIVFVVTKTKSSIEKIDEITTTPGVDVLFVRSNDLAIELGVAGNFEREEYSSAVTRVSEAASRNRKVFGFAGIYDKPTIHNWVLNELGARFVLGQ